MSDSVLPRLFLVAVSLTFGGGMLAAAEPAAKATPLLPAASADTTSDDEKTDAPAPAETKPDLSADKFWQAMKLLQSKQPSDQAAGRKALQESADLEYVHAQVMLANCYMSGSYGFSKDERKALNLFRLAAERGNGYAMVTVGTCYVTGTGTRKDDVKATQWLEAALTAKADYSRPKPPADFYKADDVPGAQVAGALNVDPEAATRATAHLLLGQIYTRREKAVEAQQQFIAAAGTDDRNGLYPAAVAAALNYAFGRGVPRDPAKAAAMLEQSKRLVSRNGVNLVHSYVALKFVDDFAAADIEEEVAALGEKQQTAFQYDIAHTFADKKSKDYNPTEAARWYQLASDNGQIWASLALGIMYANGNLGQPDPEKAFAFFEKVGGGDKPKHTLGVANYAICLYRGFGTPKDEARARELFKKHEQHEIACHLAMLGQVPEKPVSFEDEYRLIDQWAGKEKNDPVAQYLQALRYWRGDGLKQDLKESVSWLKKAAKNKHGEALNELGWLDVYRPTLAGVNDWSKSNKMAAESYKAAAEAGNLEGLTNYGDCLAKGNGVPKDEDKAIKSYEKCLELDPKHSRAHANLAQVYLARILRVGAGAAGTSDWREQMLRHLEASAEGDMPYGAWALGSLYYEGTIVTRNFDKAYHYFEIATTVPGQKGIAHYRLGYMHEKGESVPVTYSEAAYHYRLAALEGNPEALRRLIDFYITGTGVSLDFDRAMYWLNFLIIRGDPTALVTVSDILLKKGEYDRAVKLLKFLAENTIPMISGHAHQRLALCYEFGQGVKKNPRLAEKHFNLAVQLGDGNALCTFGHRQILAGKVQDGVATLTKASATSSEAAYNLGQMYFHGTYVTADRTKALQLLRQAATDRNAGAMVFLATLTWNREKDAPAIGEAIDLATRAENLGNERGAELRERLEKRRRESGATSEEEFRARAG